MFKYKNNNISILLRILLGVIVKIITATQEFEISMHKMKTVFTMGLKSVLGNTSTWKYIFVTVALEFSELVLFILIYVYM